MKITIITVCLNSEKTIAFTLNSILKQTYKNIEHILVDGGSTDSTLKIIKEYPFRNKKLINCHVKGIYAAMNLGIKNSTGEIICILNSDDIFDNEKIIENVALKIKNNKNCDVFIGDVIFFNKIFTKITRYYPGHNFKKSYLTYGIMPPHPGTFIRKKIYDKFGLYKTDYLIAADFDFFLRIFLIHKVKFISANLLITRMKTGGISGKNLYAYLISTFEIIRAFKENKLYKNFFFILLRIPSKSVQFFRYDNKNLNKNFSFQYTNFLKKRFPPDFTIVSNINKIFFKKEFILSAMNLAFLGYYIKGEILKDKNIINWPDGYFSKTFGFFLKKLPGRDVVKNIIIPNYIKELLIFGNLSDKSNIYLKNKFNKKIIHRKLKFGPIKKIIKFVNTKVNKEQLVFITLPTPKQEILAKHLLKNNKYCKVICIGGSISIASGEEKPVPQIIAYLEFLWRLRYETFRRAKRLFITFIFYFYGQFLTKKLKSLRIEYIE